MAPASLLSAPRTAMSPSVSFPDKMRRQEDFDYLEEILKRANTDRHFNFLPQAHNVTHKQVLSRSNMFSIYLFVTPSLACTAWSVVCHKSSFIPLITPLIA